MIIIFPDSRELETSAPNIRILFCISTKRMKQGLCIHIANAHIAMFIVKGLCIQLCILASPINKIHVKFESEVGVMDACLGFDSKVSFIGYICYILEVGFSSCDHLS